MTSAAPSSPLLSFMKTNSTPQREAQWRSCFGDGCLGNSESRAPPFVTIVPNLGTPTSKLVTNVGESLIETKCIGDEFYIKSLQGFFRDSLVAWFYSQFLLWQVCYLHRNLKLSTIFTKDFSFILSFNQFPYFISLLLKILNNQLHKRNKNISWYFRNTTYSSDPA